MHKVLDFRVIMIDADSKWNGKIGTVQDTLKDGSKVVRFQWYHQDTGQWDVEDLIVFPEFLEDTRTRAQETKAMMADFARYGCE